MTSPKSGSGKDDGLRTITRLAGSAPAIVALRERIEQLAPFDAVGGTLVPTLLLQGETGTGKGHVAHIIHETGPRAAGPFISVNCAAIPETMLEAELFGFEAGAFTDARRAKPGLLEAAGGGTLLLDEIDSLDLPLQGKLLTAIEAKRVRRLGAVAEHPVDVKLIAAAHADLAQLVARGRFRADLYHRLAVVMLVLPPLRERGDDVVELARGFLNELAAAYKAPAKRLTRDAETWLRQYPWPGNVRELAHAMERVTLLLPAGEVDAQALEQIARSSVAPPASAREAPGVTGEPRDEARQIRDTLRRTGGNVLRASRLLGMSRDTLRYRMRRHGIDREDLAAGDGLAPQEWDRARRAVPRALGRAPDDAVAGRAQSLRVGPVPPAPGLERKVVAILVIELTWPERGVEAPAHYEPWTEAEDWSRTVVEKVAGFGGVLVQRSPSLLVWTFGLPHAVDQLPDRAVQAALAVQQLASVREHAPDVRISIHQAAVLVDEQSPDPGGRIVPVGDALALPVRMLGDVGSGEILASAEIARQVEGWAALAVRELRARTAGAEPALAYVVLGLGPRRDGPATGRRRTEFVGREGELSTVIALLARAETGSGHAVGLAGEPGVGKSRLLEEFRQRIASRRVIYAEGHCLAYARMTPFLPLLELLRAQFGILATDRTEAIAEKARAGIERLGLAAETRVSHLAPLLGATATGASTATDPQGLRTQVFETLTQVIRAMSRGRPLILALENLHWLDPTSEEFLEFFVDRISTEPILLVATWRPGYRPAWLARSYSTQIALSPLGYEESRRIARSALGATGGRGEIEEAILDKAEGNAFFIEELARTVVEQGGRIGLAVPDTVQAVLSTRIDRLALADKHLLQAASVIGTRVPVRLLAAVSGIELEALRPALARLQAAEFLYERSAVVEPIFQFRHALTHDAIYQSLSRERRRLLHARAAAALADIDPDPPDDQVDQLAQHALHGELWEKAVVLLRKAGAAAMARSAHREAALRFEQALRTLERLSTERDTRAESIDVRLELRNALVPLGESARIVTEMDSAEAAARALGDQPRLALIASYMTRQLFLLGDHERAITSGQRALAAAGEHLPTRIATNLYLGYAYHALGDYRRAIEALGQSVRHLTGPRRYEHSGLAPLPAVSAGSRLAQCCAELGEFQQGEAHGQQALQIAEKAGHTISLIQACRGLGVLCLRQGELDRAASLLGRGLTLSREARLPLELPVIASALGSVQLHAGRREEALELLEEAVEQARALKRVDQQALRLIALGEGYLASGRIGDAWALFRNAMEAARAHKERGAEAYALRFGGALVAAGAPVDHGTADDLYRQAMARAETLAMRPLVALCRLDLGRHLLRLGRIEEARRDLAQAADELRSLRMTLWLREAEAAASTLG